VAKRTFLAPLYYSQLVEFASPLSAVFILLLRFTGLRWLNKFFFFVLIYLFIIIFFFFFFFFFFL